jgi:hypothetical protein
MQEVNGAWLRDGQRGWLVSSHGKVNQVERLIQECPTITAIVFVMAESCLTISFHFGGISKWFRTNTVWRADQIRDQDLLVLRQIDGEKKLLKATSALKNWKPIDEIKLWTLPNTNSEMKNIMLPRNTIWRTLRSLFLALQTGWDSRCDISLVGRNIAASSWKHPGLFESRVEI